MSTVTEELREFLMSRAAKENLELATDLYIWKAEAERMTTGYDAAQSELAALREELVQSHQREAKLQDMVTAVERKNAELEVFERFAGYLLDHCEGETIYEESLQYWLSESIKLYKPTESGASE